MNFAKTTKQQQLAKPAAAPANYSTTRPLGLTATSSPHLVVLPLPKTLISAQHCFSKQQQTQSPAPHARLMIKNIENCSNQTDCDENEEEKDKAICNVLQRRESVPEDAPTFSTLKLNTIQESAEISTSTEASSQSSTLNLSSSLQLETFSTPTIVSPDTTTADLSTSAEEQQISTTIHSNEHLNNSYSSTSSSTNNQTGDINVISSSVEETSTLYLSTASAKTKEQQRKDSSSTSESPREGSGGSLREKHNQSLANLKISSTTQNAGGSASGGRVDEDTVSKASDSSGELARSLPTPEAVANAGEKPPKNCSKLSERAKKKSWYNVLYPNYKSRSQDFKKLFKEVPNDERLIVDYSCALQRDILVQGRLYVSQNYVCFHANIFSWETYLTITWKDVTSITKEKTALVIPNAISICTAKEKYFFATFTSRDKAFLMLFRIWQNTLMNKQMPPQEMWKWVHNCYGDELGLTTDDEDYIDPTTVPSKTDEEEGETDFVSALDDTEFRRSLANSSEYSTAASSSNPFGGKSGSGRNQRNSGSSSTGSGSGSVKKTKSRSYFFGSNKSSTTASASGSDNKASDNNSGADRKTKTQTMKPNAKELTLTSAKPDESTGSAATSNSGGAGASANGEPKEAKNDSKRKVSKNSRQRDESLSKNSEALPTDMSDSSDSDENKIPFVSTAECTSTHEGRQLVHTILPINIETLFNLLFSKSKFLVDFHAMRKSTDTNFSMEWTTNEEGQKVRTVNVTVQLAASVGPKTSKVTEHQVMRECSKPGELYSIDINSVNAGIPYADSFSVQMHYCLVRTIDDHTMLSVHAQIKYKKSIWGVVKGFIEKNTWAGLEDFYTAQLHALQSETCIPPAKGKGRRPRRGTATQIRPIEESPQSPTKIEPSDNVLSAHTKHPHLPMANKALLPGGENKRNYKWLSIFVIGLLCFLLALNVILLFKLWKLEERIEVDLESRARMPNLSQLKQLPNNHQDWIQLLRQQEILHEEELKKWHTVLQTAIELLKKTEKTLGELMFR